VGGTGIGRVSDHIYDGLLFLVALHGVESGAKTGYASARTRGDMAINE
jgi:hypothetical protein